MSTLKRHDSSLLVCLTTAPKSGRIGAKRLADLIAEEDARPLRDLLEESDKARRVLAGIAEGSPFLWRLVRRDPVHLANMLRLSTSDAFAEIHSEMRCAGDCRDVVAGMKTLRQLRNRHALLTAIADIGGVLDIAHVTHALSDFADEAVRAALRLAIAESGGSLAIPDMEAPEMGLGLFVLALGKHGGQELNYSSDIDLACFYDPLAPAFGARPDHLDRAVALIKLLAHILNQRTVDGYVLRVDLRLRPDPGTTPIAMPVNAAIAYYETVGQNWERAAMIKARVVAGDAKAGAAYLAELQPFIWRKYFDYGSIADIHAMKRQIYAVKGHDTIAVAGHDLKLGRGGIREIEFFVQTQQLVYGGRRSSLRGARTLDMLDALLRESWITPDAAKDLSQAYRALRTLEHRVQMLNDEQTQKLPKTDDDLTAFARFCGLSRGAFEKHLVRTLKKVEHHYARLFEGGPVLASGSGSLVFTGADADPGTRETLRRLGFKKPDIVAETVRGWHYGRRSAVTTPRAREVLTELVPGLLESFGRSSDPDGAILALDAALQRMPAAVELFAILHSNPSLRQLFAECLGTAPRLSQIVAQSPHVLDVLVDPDFASMQTSPTLRLGVRLEREADYELFLERARILVRGERFLIGTRVLSRLIPPAELGAAHTVLAEAVVDQVFKRARHEFSERHGHIPDGQVVILAYGKAGSGELTAASDLDLVVIYDADGEAWSDGNKPLMTSEYYAKLTQRLVAALSAPMRAGTLYDVDLRLRPSGKKGPVAASISAFSEYFRGEAELWEHLALSRARVFSGDAALGKEIAVLLNSLISQPRDASDVRRQTANMRALMAREKPGKDRYDVKDTAGGLVDIEFIIQSLALIESGRYPELLVTGTRNRLEIAGRLGLLATDEAESLINAWDLQLGFQQITRLVFPGSFVEAETGLTSRKHVARLLDCPDFGHLQADLDRLQASTRALFKQHIGPLS
ncbi:GlnE Glutamine synthetase adenylyltransferase [Rhabdaerophilaceae bacterium]